MTSPAQLGAGDVTAIYPQAPGTNVPSPGTVTAGGETLTFTETGTFRVLLQGGGVIGASWFGNFPNGTKVLYTGNAIFAQGAGPVTIDFSPGVSEFGLLFQNNRLESTVNTFSVFDDGTLLGIFSGVNQGNNVLFLGARATGGDVITRVTITGAPSSGPNDFAIGPVTFAPVAAGVPEPSSLALLGLGTAALAGWRWRRKQRRA